MKILNLVQIIISEVFQIFPQLKAELVNRECWSYITVYDKIIFTESSQYRTEKNKLRKWIINHLFEILKDPYFTNFRKIAVLSLLVSPWIYRQIVGLNQ